VGRKKEHQWDEMQELVVHVHKNWAGCPTTVGLNTGFSFKHTGMRIVVNKNTKHGGISQTILI